MTVKKPIFTGSGERTSQARTSESANLHGKATAARVMPQAPGCGGSPTPAVTPKDRENLCPSPPRATPARCQLNVRARTLHKAAGFRQRLFPVSQPRAAAACAFGGDSVPLTRRMGHCEAATPENRVKNHHRPDFYYFRGAGTLPRPKLRSRERAAPGQLCPGSAQQGARSPADFARSASPGSGWEGKLLPRLPGEQGEAPGPRNAPAGRTTISASAVPSHAPT